MSSNSFSWLAAGSTQGSNDSLSVWSATGSTQGLNSGHVEISDSPSKKTKLSSANKDFSDITIPAGRWDASEELSSFLDVVFADKPLSVYDHKQIPKEFPRPNVELVFTPVLDDYLGSLVTGAKGVDKEAKKLQDQLLDIVGPLSMAFEHISSCQENEDDSGTITLPTQDVDGLYACLSEALALLGSVNAQYKVQRRKQVLDKVNPQISSLASEPFPDGGKNLFGPSFEEKELKRNETVKILSKAAPKKSNTQFFSERDLLRIQARARGSISWNMVNSPTRLPNQREKLIFQGPGPEQGKVPSCSAKSELCCTPKFPVAVASQSNTGMLPVKENLNFPKVKLFLSSLGSLILCRKLASSYKRPLGNFGYFRVPYSLDSLQSYHHQVFLPSQSVCRARNFDRQRIGRANSKAGDPSGFRTQLQHRFCQQPVCDPQKGRRTKTRFQPPPVKSIYNIRKFQMEGIHMLRDLLKPNDFMVKIDLKDAYFTVTIWKGHQKFLRFLWKGTQWEFACLPFGIASAPRVFTKILNPVIGLLRKQGICLIIYLDDFLLMASTEETLSYHVTLMVTLLEMLGFVVNYQKSQLNPTQSIEFLSFHINSVTLNISLPLDKVKSIRKECQRVVENPDITIRELAQLLGKLSALIQAVFPAPLHYCHFQAVKKHSLALHGG